MTSGYRNSSSEHRNSASKSVATPVALALRMAVSAAGRADPRFNRADNTSSSAALRDGGKGILKIAAEHGVGSGTVQRIKAEMLAAEQPRGSP